MKGKEMKRNASEETDRGVDGMLPSWGAGVLRPYITLPSRRVDA
jgi:hypothetical protein